MNYKLAIFDMDGTILDTLEDLAGSLNHALAACGFPPRTIDEVRCFVGNGIHRLVELGVPESSTSDDIEKVFTCFNEHYALHCSDHTSPYDGIPEVLRALRAQGILTAVVSNKADYAVQLLCTQYFPGLFDCAVGAKEGVRKKPCPDSVNTVLQTLNVPREQAVYIGDSEVDIKTAANADMDCIIVDWGFRERDFLLASGAENIVSAPCELL